MSKYSQLKPAFHLDRIVQLRQGKNPVPVHVQLILSDLCQQSCSWCAYRMDTGLSTELFWTETTHNPNRKIETSKAREILDDCASMGVKAIQFTGGGEPTVHPEHRELFAYAQDLGLDTSLVTNGVRLDVESDSTLRMKWIRVSIDAGREETYCKIRNVNATHWRKAWANVERLAKRFEGALGVGFVVAPESFKEIGECASRCKYAGVSNMRVGAVFSEQGIGFYGGLIPEIVEAINEAKAKYDGDGFEIIDLFGRRLGDLENGSPTDPFCGYQHMTMYIGGDLNVYRCCNTSYTKAGLLGSLKETSLKELFGTLDYSFDARQCRYCQFLGQNEAISALIKEPEHVNFV
jgi:MoaA/NifB/PqqE/SkfB family radical SAM enzyme